MPWFHHVISRFKSLQSIKVEKDPHFQSLLKKLYPNECLFGILAISLRMLTSSRRTSLLTHASFASKPIPPIPYSRQLIPEDKPSASMVSEEKPIPDTTENNQGLSTGTDKKPARERSVDPKPQPILQARKPRKNQPAVLWRTPERRSKPRKRESVSTVQHATAGTQSGCAKGFYAVRLKAARSLRLRANVVARRTRTKTKGGKNKRSENKNAHKPTASKTIENDKVQKIQSNKKTEDKKGNSLMDSHPNEIRDALTQDGMASLTLSSNDLRTTKAAWVKKYIAILTEKEHAEVAAGQANQLLTNAEKYKKAVEAWMSSYLRSVLISGKDKGFASIPASMLAVWVWMC